MEKTRILLSGCGKMGFAHAKALSKRGDVSLLFVSRTLASAEKFSRVFGGRAVSSLKEGLLEADALLLATPPNNRLGPISLARKMKKPVLSEKPLCSEKGELGKMAKIAANPKGGFFVQISENWVYKRTAQLASEIVSSGKIGELREISVVRGKKVSDSGWRENYGALLEGGIHQVALVSSLSGFLRPKKVSAEFGSERPERESSIGLDYGNFSASIRYSWKRGLVGGTIVRGTKGRILIDNWLLSATLLSKKGIGFFPAGFSDPYGLSAIHSDFLSCVRGRRSKPLYDFSRARNDLETVFRAYEFL